MPLRVETKDPADPHSLQSVPETFIIFYSSIVDGRLWCGDTRDVDGLIQETFDPEDAPTALIAYVGDKPTWKSPDSVFKSEPWNLTSIPTIVRVENGKETGRLVESEITPGRLAKFVRGTPAEPPEP